MVLTLVIVVGLVASFFLGSRYGRDAEARAIAYELRFESCFAQEYAAVAHGFKTKVNAGFNRIRKYL